MKFACIALVSAISAIQITESVTAKNTCISHDQSDKMFELFDTSHTDQEELNSNDGLGQEELAAAIEAFLGRSSAEASTNAAIVLKKYGSVKKNLTNKDTNLNKW